MAVPPSLLRRDPPQHGETGQVTHYLDSARYAGETVSEAACERVPLCTRPPALSPEADDSKYRIRVWCITVQLGSHATLGRRLGCAFGPLT
jgi:hypothetical protein